MMGGRALTSVIWRECMFWSLGLAVQWVILTNPKKNYDFIGLKLLMENHPFVKFVYYISEEDVIIVGVCASPNSIENFLILKHHFNFSGFVKDIHSIINYLADTDWACLNYQTHICLWAGEEYQQIIGAFLDQIFIENSNLIPPSWGLVKSAPNQSKNWNYHAKQDYSTYGKLYRGWLKDNPSAEPFSIHFLMWYVKNYPI